MIAIRSFMNSAIRMLSFIFFILCFSVFTAASGEEAFSVQCADIVSNSTNYFFVSAPESGTLIITIQDNYYTYRDIRTDVPSGTSSYEWDGCSWNSAKLPLGNYRFICTLTGNSGSIYTYSFKSSVKKNAQYLQFALPSSHTVYLSDADDWFIEAKSVLDGTLVLDFYPAGTDLVSFSAKKPMHQRRVEHFTFSKLITSKAPDPGEYTVKVYEISRPSDAYMFQLRIDYSAPASEPVRVTGEIMPPEGADDAMIWKFMMKPSVVLDIDYLKSHKVYSEPDQKSQSLGTLHGQTQGLRVLDITGSWAMIGAWNHEDASYMEGWVPLDKLKIVYPDNEYGLLLNKKDQTLTLFRYGKRIATMLISTGRMSRYKLIRETSAGCFLTGLHRVDFSMQGNRYDYVIQYDGGNLLHQVPYTSDGKKDMRYGKAYLGSKASHACIRIQDTPAGEYGINAYWIWTHLPYHTRIMILDDREEREKNVAYLKGQTIPVLFPGLSAGTDYSVYSVDETTIRLTFAGDVIPGEKAPFRNNTITAYLDRYGYGYPFGGLYELFSADDITCVNLDCVLKDDNSGQNHQRKSVYLAKHDCAEIFPAGSVEMVCLANTHSMDFGQAGLDATLSALADRTMSVRTGHPVSLDLKGHRVGFGACTDKEYLSDQSVIEQDIFILKESGCDYIVYQCHWESEDKARRGNLQEAMAWACQRAGADIVIGHGPSFVQGVDLLKGMPVIYSLGKLIRGGSGLRPSCDALIARISISFLNEKASTGIELIPVLATSSKDKNNYKPAVAAGKDKTRILTLIQSDTVYDLSGLINGR